MLEMFLRSAIPIFKRIPLWTGVKVALAFGLLYLILSQVSYQDLSALVFKLQLAWLIPTVFFSFSILWAFARRFAVLLKGQVPFSKLLGVVILQTAVGNLLGAVFGALSYIAMLRGRYQIKVESGFGSVLLARWGDLAVWIPTLMVSGIFVWDKLNDFQNVAIVVSIVLSAVVIAVPIGIVYSKPLARWMQPRIKPSSRHHRIEAGIEQVGALASLNNREAIKLLIKVFSRSLVVMGFSFLYAFCHARLFALPLSLAEIIFVNAIVLLISYLPIQVFGGLGVYEFSAVYLYGLFGVAPGYAISVVIGTRILIIVLTGASLLYLPFEDMWIKHSSGGIDVASPKSIAMRDSS